MIQIKHASLMEIASKTDAEAWRNMRLGTVVRFEAAREAYGAPITISHAFRTAKDKARLKAQGYEVASRSAHEVGYAMDLHPANARLGVDLEAWKKLLDALWQAGFRRFGIMREAIHVDDDPARPATIWGYGNTNPTVWAWVQGWYNERAKK
jgi:uncharacterized protein YcbK (DUF882 family)